MSARSERRKQAKIAARGQMALQSSRFKIQKLLIGGASLMVVAGVAGTLGYRAHSGAGIASARGPASLPPAQSDGQPGAKNQKTQTFEEAAADLRKKEEFQKKSKEWAWCDEGHTEKVIEAYSDTKPGTSHSHEERTRLLTALAHTVRERKEWPPEFSQAKAKAVMDFLGDILSRKPGPGTEPVAAAHAVLAYALKIPELRTQAQAILMKFHDIDDRTGPRAESLELLSQLHSVAAIPLLRKAIQSDEDSTSRAAAYAMANYLGTPLERQPRESLFSTARKNPRLAPLAAKLLAYHGVKDAAALVPSLLTAKADAADIEAGAYVIEQLKLKQYVGLLGQFSGGAGNPFLQQQITAAQKAATGQ